jgi:hypothetical protein
MVGYQAFFGITLNWLNYELRDKGVYSGFVCDDYKFSERVEKMAQPTRETAFRKIKRGAWVDKS